MTKQFPLPCATALACTTTSRPKLPVRALVHLVARRTMLANLTDPAHQLGAVQLPDGRACAPEAQADLPDA